MPETNVLPARPPLNPTLMKILHDSTAAGTYALLLLALADAREANLLLDALNPSHVDGVPDDATTTSEATGDLVGASSGTP